MIIYIQRPTMYKIKKKTKQKSKQNRQKQKTKTKTKNMHTACYEGPKVNFQMKQ